MKREISMWSQVIDMLENGYEFDIVDYEHDIWERQEIDTELLTAIEREELERLDQRFVEATLPNTHLTSIEVFIQPGWEWLNRRPKWVRGEFVESFR